MSRDDGGMLSKRTVAKRFRRGRERVNKRTPRATKTRVIAVHRDTQDDIATRKSVTRLGDLEPPITLHCITLHYITVQYSTVQYTRLGDLEPSLERGADERRRAVLRAQCNVM